MQCSNACLFLSYTFSQVPVFVQTQQKWRRIYAGECQGPSVRTDFEMVHLCKVPNQYNHLSGLLDIFKAKIVSAVEQVRSDKLVIQAAVLRLFPLIRDAPCSLCLQSTLQFALLTFSKTGSSIHGRSSLQVDTNQDSTKNQNILVFYRHFVGVVLFLVDFDTLLGGEVGGVEFGKLPFGACEEPIRCS